MKKLWLVLGIGVALSCGGGDGPFSPSSPLLQSLRLVAGDTGEPVGGAQVVLAGRSYTSSTAGEVTLESATGMASAVRVDSAGYLVRETLAPRATQDAISLWPLRGQSEEYVRALLYKPSDTTRREVSPMPDQPLMRIMDSRVSIVPSAAMRADQEAMNTLRRAIAVMNEATAGVVTFSLDHSPTASVVFRTLFDEDVRDGAFTYRTLRGHTIVGGRIVFSNRDSFRPARDVRYVVHELGHALGLQHSVVATDMMYYTAHVTSPEEFTPAERLTIKLLLQRAPGNLFPDRDPRQN